MKKILAFGIALAILFSLVGCKTPKPDKIDIGFGGRDTRRIGDFLCGAKSDILIFDVDNIEIDFYFGFNTDRPIELRSVSEGYERVGIVAYFYNNNWRAGGAFFGEHLDYRNIEDTYFIKEYSEEEFFTEKYAAKYISKGLGRGSTTFNYHETFKVPKEIFDIKSYSFYFYVVDIWRTEEGKYIIGHRLSPNPIQLHYGDIVDGQIKILDKQVIVSKP